MSRLVQDTRFPTARGQAVIVRDWFYGRGGGWRYSWHYEGAIVWHGPHRSVDACLAEAAALRGLTTRAAEYGPAERREPELVELPGRKRERRTSRLEVIRALARGRGLVGRAA